MTTDLRLDRTAQLVDQLDSHWHSQLRPRLEGMTDEEYHFSPAPAGRTWGVRPRGTGHAQIQGGSGDFTIEFAHPEPEPTPLLSPHPSAPPRGTGPTSPWLRSSCTSTARSSTTAPRCACSATSTPRPADRPGRLDHQLIRDSPHTQKSRTAPTTESRTIDTQE